MLENVGVDYSEMLENVVLSVLKFLEKRMIHIAKSVESINLLLQQVKKAGGVCTVHLSVVELK